MDCYYDIATCQGRIAIAEKYDAIKEQTLKPVRNAVVNDWISYKGDTYIIIDMIWNDTKTISILCHKIVLMKGNPEYTLDINLRKEIKRKDILVYQ